MGICNEISLRFKILRARICPDATGTSLEEVSKPAARGTSLDKHKNVAPITVKPPACGAAP